jgi:hypothetical protein
MAERSLSVDHVPIWRWVQCYAPLFDQRIRLVRAESAILWVPKAICYRNPGIGDRNRLRVPSALDPGPLPGDAPLPTTDQRGRRSQPRARTTAILANVQVPVSQVQATKRPALSSRMAERNRVSRIEGLPTNSSPVSSKSAE